MSDLHILEELEIDSNYIQKSIESYRNNEFTLAVTGEFSSGKSCLMNAVIGDGEFLPMGDTECTAVYVDINSGDENTLAVLQADGSIESLDFSKENIEQYARYSRDNQNRTIALIMTLKEFPFDAEVHFLDCPGTNTGIGEHEVINRQAIKQSDAVIYVINKTVSGSDLDSIERIYDFNQDIVFVLTHIDEGEGNSLLPEKLIEKFVTEATYNISERLGIFKEEVIIFPVGSKRALTDRTLLDAMLDYLRDSLICKDRAFKRQKTIDRITSYLKESTADKSAQYEASLAADRLSDQELEFKISQAASKLEEISRQIDRETHSLNKLSESRIDTLVSKAEYLAKNYSKKAQDDIKHSSENSSEFVKRVLTHRIRQYEKRLDQEVKTAIQDIAGYEYNAVNEKFAALSDDEIVAKLPQLSPPDLSGENEGDDFELESLKQQISLMENKQKHLENEKFETDDQSVSLQNEYDDSEKELQNAESDRIRLGEYVPEFKHYTVKGGGETGAKVGKMIGGLADIALLFYTPAGPLKAADAAMDAAKGAKMVVNVIKKAGYGAKKIHDDVSRQKASLIGMPIDSQEVEEDTDSEDRINTALGLNALSGALDLVQLSFWGEKIGSLIGNMLKPSNVLEKEDLEKKRLYQERMNDIKSRYYEQKVKRDELKAQLSQKNSDKKAIQEELNKVKRKIESLKTEKDFQEQQYKQQLEQKQKSAKEDYYCKEISSFFDRMSEEYMEGICYDIRTASEQLHKKASADAAVRIEELQNRLDGLKVERSDLSKRESDHQDYLDKIAMLLEHVDDWVDNYGI